MSPLPGAAPARRPRSRSPAGRTSWRRCGRSSRARPGEGRRAALVAGEPGSGKSRLVRELAHDVAEEGATRPLRRLRRGRRVAVRAVREALEHLVRRRGPGDAPATPRRRSAASSRGCCPSLADRVGGSPGPRAADADTERHRLHTAVTDLLVGDQLRGAGAARARGPPLGGRPTLLLTRHLVRSGAAARMLIVATFRDADGGRAPRASPRRSSTSTAPRVSSVSGSAA